MARFSRLVIRINFDGLSIVALGWVSFTNTFVAALEQYYSASFTLIVHCMLHGACWFNIFRFAFLANKGCNYASYMTLSTGNCMVSRMVKPAKAPLLSNSRYCKQNLRRRLHFLLRLPRLGCCRPFRYDCYPLLTPDPRLWSANFSATWWWAAHQVPVYASAPGTSSANAATPDLPDGTVDVMPAGFMRRLWFAAQSAADLVLGRPSGLKHGLYLDLYLDLSVDVILIMSPQLNGGTASASAHRPPTLT
jgi:hypothetical protein